MRLFLGLAALYAAAFAGRAWWNDWVRAVHLETGQKSYLHYDFIDVRLWSRDPAVNALWRDTPPKVAVTRGGEILTTIAGVREVPLAFDADRGEWKGRWPCPWNAPAGRYDLKLLDQDNLVGRLKAKPFSIGRRRPWPVPQGFSVVTLESVAPLRTMKVRAPSGEMKDWRGLLDWVQYVGADAFWMLGGQTPGEKPGEVWVSRNLSMIPEVARECRRRGLKFGVYAMCYLTMSQERLPRYEYARDVRDGHSYLTRAISLADDRRVSDVADLLKSFRDIPGVDFVGLDYIRNALGGYELADEFYADMTGVPPPPSWPSLSHEERMVYFARKKIMRRDKDFIDAWQWWRAHRAAGIVRRIKDEVGDSIPLWAFTLTWDKGWHHGQDPPMMNDAGVDLDALMLYEADTEQFEQIIGDWNRYVKRGDVQLLAGDVVDWPLHQKNPAGPREFYRRLAEAVDHIYSDGPARGVFIHDLDRALWGRLGPWGTRGWLDQSKRAVEYCKAQGRGLAAK